MLAGARWIPPRRLPTLSWLTENYHLPAEAGDLPGPYNPDYVPSLWGIFAAIDDDSISLVATMKAAQIGWTFGLIGYLGKVIDQRPTRIIMLFPKDGAAREFSDEKFTPAVKATPVMREKIDVSTSRRGGNRVLFKKFDGGFLKMLGSNSISNVKSTPAELVIVEEPDDTNENVKEQGDAIRLSRERLKRSRHGKQILGGTPGVKGLSRVEEHLELSDQRVLPIACHECGEKHVLDWENVTWHRAEGGTPHVVYGLNLPETSAYACPHCGSAWDDWQRQQNIVNTVKSAAAAGDPLYGWRPTVDNAPPDVAGFKELNELYVCIPGTSLADVVRDYLEALHEVEKGDQSALIVFTNSKLARAYEYKSNAPEVDELAGRAEDYDELVVPERALVLTAGVDVQHDRLAVTIWAWGPDEESWLIYWGELAAKVSTTDSTDPVWSELDKLLFTPRQHIAGFYVGMSAVSIDSGDGGTSDQVYTWARPRIRKGVMATKGASVNAFDREIYTRPKEVDYKTKTKASKHGVKVYVIGTHKAKDLLIGDRGRITLIGTGPGRMHWYENVRADFYEQLTSEVKAPARRLRGKMVWQLKTGVRNEALDCTVGANHAARSIKLHVMNKAWWEALRAKLAQADLFNQPTDGAGGAPPTEKRTSKSHAAKSRGGFANRWRK